VSVETINGHVLFPHAPNWETEPDWQRSWQTFISDAVAGQESRFGMRDQALTRLDWTVLALDLQERARLEDRMLAAKKSGKACAPHWGRASMLASPVTSTTVTVAATVWPWAVDDYLFLMDDFRNYDARKILTVAGNVLTLTAAVSRTYAAGLQVWPLIYGKFVADSMDGVTSHHGETALGIQELRSPATATVGTMGSAGTGVGGWKVGTTLVVS